MNATSNPQAAADEARKEARKNYREMTSPDGSVPGAMPSFDYNAEAELFPLMRVPLMRGMRGKFTKRSVGYKRFTSAAKAIRFAVEELPPDLLRGAYLEVDEERFDANGIRQLYESGTYPLGRRA